jgi:PAS domain S-box-containing protein
MLIPPAKNEHPIRILIADDEPRILDEYLHVLGNAREPDLHQRALIDLETELFGGNDVEGDRVSYDLCCCRQAKEAIAIVEKSIRDARPFAIAFLDVRMPPGPDGVYAAERIRKLDPQVNIVFVTGYSDTPLEHITSRVPPSDKLLYLQKPLQSSELKQLAHALSGKWMAERHLQATRARLQQILSSTPAVVYTCTPCRDRAATFVSDNIIEQFGYTPAAFLAEPDFWLGRVHSEDLPHVFRDLKRLQESGEIALEYRFRHADGSFRWISDRVKLMLDDSGTPKEMVGCWIDVTEQRRAEETIRTLAYFDGLTGLPNRALMRELLGRALAAAERHQRSLAVLFVDLDQFKRINDTLGHDMGDLLLQEVAKRLVSCIRRSDAIFSEGEVGGLPEAGAEQAISRLGGDEFVLILSEIGSSEDAANVARRIAAALAQPIRLGHDEVLITASIGISVYPYDATSAETLLKHADVAMYHAKEQGRNSYRFFTEALNERTARRFTIESNLRRALERGEFVLFYQPRIDIRAQRVVGMEALLRWRRPQEGLVLPGEFIPVAEENGLIVPIGEWVLQEACRQAANWYKAGLAPLVLSVNMSAGQFKRGRLVERICSALQDTGLPAEFLELELTESMLIEDTDLSTTLLARLKEIGVKISVDDFGTGYSSLSYLKRFALTALKVDRSLVRDLATDANDSAIVSAAIALAHSLRLRVVAEGVEDDVQAGILKAQGCDEAQGYLFSPPLEAEGFEHWLRNGYFPLAVST